MLCQWGCTSHPQQPPHEPRAGEPSSPDPKARGVPVLTVLCRAPVAPGEGSLACPGSSAVAVIGATPRQGHLMEGGGIQHPAEREVGHPLEIPVKGGEISAPTSRGQGLVMVVPGGLT